MKIRIDDDFDLEKIACSGQCFRAFSDAEGTYRFISGGRVLYIRKVQDAFEVSCTKEQWDAFWFSYFDLGRNYRAVRGSIPEKDHYLRKAADNGAGIRILRQEPFETLVSFIISQRKNIPSIRKAVEDLSERYGSEIRTDRGTVHAFPTAEQLSCAGEAVLREMKLGYRAPFIADAVQRVLSGRTDPEAIGRLGDEELLQKLMEVKGVGIKVAKCTALFAYGRTALSPVDTWISRIIEREYGGSDPFPEYGDNAGIMQQYAFFYAVTHKEETARG